MMVPEARAALEAIMAPIERAMGCDRGPQFRRNMLNMIMLGNAQHELLYVQELKVRASRTSLIMVPV